MKVPVEPVWIAVEMRYTKHILWVKYFEKYDISDNLGT